MTPTAQAHLRRLRRNPSHLCRIHSLVMTISPRPTARRSPRSSPNSGCAARQNRSGPGKLNIVHFALRVPREQHQAGRHHHLRRYVRTASTISSTRSATCSTRCSRTVQMRRRCQLQQHRGVPRLRARQRSALHRAVLQRLSQCNRARRKDGAGN